MLRFALRLCVWAGLLGLHSVAAFSPAAFAQTPKPSAANSKSSSSSTTAKNVKTGTITAMDEESITLRAANDKTTPYVLTEKTRFRKSRLDSERDAFKVGEAVVIKLRKVRNKDEYVVQEVNDRVSWDWISDLRKKTVQAVIQEIEEKTLSVKVGTEAVLMVYTISAKTKWAKGGKDATPEDFKAGDTVTIVPRGLPSGNVMATIVADNAQGAALTKERYARSVSGTLQAIDGTAKRMTVLTPLKDMRNFAYTDKTEVKVGYKKVPFPTLRVGQKIRASLKKEGDTEETATTITIESKTATRGAVKVPKVVVGDPTEVTPKKVIPRKP